MDTNTAYKYQCLMAGCPEKSNTLKKVKKHFRLCPLRLLRSPDLHGTFLDEMVEHGSTTEEEAANLSSVQRPRKRNGGPKIIPKASRPRAKLQKHSNRPASEQWSRLIKDPLVSASRDSLPLPKEGVLNFLKRSREKLRPRRVDLKLPNSEYESIGNREYLPGEYSQWRRAPQTTKLDPGNTRSNTGLSPLMSPKQRLQVENMASHDQDLSSSCLAQYHPRAEDARSTASVLSLPCKVTSKLSSNRQLERERGLLEDTHDVQQSAKYSLDTAPRRSEERPYPIPDSLVGESIFLGYEGQNLLDSTVVPGYEDHKSLKQASPIVPLLNDRYSSHAITSQFPHMTGLVGALDYPAFASTRPDECPYTSSDYLIDRTDPSDVFQGSQVDERWSATRDYNKGTKATSQLMTRGSVSYEACRPDLPISRTTASMFDDLEPTLGLAHTQSEHMCGARTKGQHNKSKLYFHQVTHLENTSSSFAARSTLLSAQWVMTPAYLCPSAVFAPQLTRPYPQYLRPPPSLRPPLPPRVIALPQLL